MTRTLRYNDGNDMNQRLALVTHSVGVRLGVDSLLTDPLQRDCIERCCKDDGTPLPLDAAQHDDDGDGALVLVLTVLAALMVLLFIVWASLGAAWAAPGAATGGAGRIGGGGLTEIRAPPLSAPPQIPR